MKFLIWKLYAIYNYFCKYRLNKLVPGILEVMDAYQKKTKSTGTKYPTLYKAVKTILKNKPLWILEAGTGTSTIVLAETVLFIKKLNPEYECKIISMESVEKWYALAKKLLPEKYQNIVEIRFGEREKYEYSIFRGYTHSNIPNKPYDMVFVDAPSYYDVQGDTTCMDALKVRINSDKDLVYCVIDTRISSVFMMQKIFGLRTLRYFPFHRACMFAMHKIKKYSKLNSQSFSYSLHGKCSLKTSEFKE